MSEQTAEERRTALVERVADAMRATREFRAGAAFGVPEDARVPYTTGLAEAVMALLESGDAGVYLVAGAEVQGTVAIVLGQLREARAGADFTDPPEDAERTPAQVWGHLLRLPEADRIRLLGLMLDGAGDGFMCRTSDHRGELEYLKRVLPEARAEVEQLRAEVARLKTARDAHAAVCLGVGP